MKNLSVKIVLVVALLIGFTCGTVFAQGVDFTIWNGSLWKMKQDLINGYYFEDETALASSAKARNSEPVWGIMTADATGESMSIDVYEGRGGNCHLNDTIPLVKKAGGPLEFFATTEVDEADEIYATGLFSFTGKLKDGALQKGKMTTLGAYVLQQDFDAVNDLLVCGLNMYGTTVAEKAFKCNFR